jgi:glyoxylase-like metal-dependent hydrolase (beta-lactamase superfamily II)
VAQILDLGGPDWTEPGAWPVAPGVLRVPLPLPSDGLRAVNVYVLEHADGLTLVDGGWAVPAAGPALDRALRRVGHRASDVRRVLVTHVHRDHYTQAVVLRREHGARVGLGEGERAALVALNDLDRIAPQAGWLVESGAPDLARWWAQRLDRQVRDLSLWEDPDEWLKPDRAIAVGGRELTAYATPGHTQGHLVFADLAAGLLFAGDHVLPTITPSIGFEPVAAALPLADYLESLATVRTLPDLALLPAHGAAGGSVHARVDELLAHHDERLAHSLRAVEAGARTAREVAERLTWTGRGRPFGTLDHYNAALAVLETRAHLEVLAARGQVARATDGSVVSYVAVSSVAVD